MAKAQELKRGSTGSVPKALLLRSCPMAGRSTKMIGPGADSPQMSD
jgi:hypothetical protein